LHPHYAWPLQALPRSPKIRCRAPELGPNIKNLVGNADPTRADYGFGLGLAGGPRPAWSR
jgi:hypothetical protein